MARYLALSFVAASVAAAAPEPAITPRAELHPRADSSILGYISTSGASELSDLRSCDFPATLTQSGSFAQCCEKDKACDFFTSCSAGKVIAASTSIFCDSGYCNTGLIVPSAGAKDGKSYLGCWATDLGKEAFALVQDIGTATPAPSPTRESSGSDSAAATNGATESTGSATETETETGSSSPTSDSSPSASPTTGAAAGIVKPLTGVVGLIAVFAALL